MLSLRDRNQKEIQKKLQDEMERQGFDGLILTDYGAIYYATGYASRFQQINPIPGYTMAVVPAKGPCTLILSEFEMQSPGVYCKDIEIKTLTSGIFIDEVESMVTEKPETPDSNAGFLHALNLIKSVRSKAKIGVQIEYMTVGPMKYLMDHAGDAQLADCGDLLNRVRAIKTEWEIAVMKEGARVSETAIFQVMEEFRPGMTQAEYLNLFSRKCFEQSVNVIDAIDMNAFGTHFSPVVMGCDTPSKEGDIIRFDGGATYLSYLTDFARVFCLGKPSQRAKDVYAAECAGYDAAMSLIKPGVSMSYVFEQAQEAVRKNGIPNYLRGFVGHSIGCNKFAEEWPYVSPGSREVFQPGMVLSIELPYYNPNLGGFNIEDTIVITDTGYEKFTDCPHHIIEI
ncbi:MAG: Xaa-Pro peptidase family protein [Clostridium sp.]|nr:Xaa-Pro peptidase family protein [Clostridium sp.]